MPPIREATASDAAVIRAIHESAFARRDEADLVERLIEDGDALLSLLAGESGHVLFSRMWIDTADAVVAAVALAPVAVAPAHQRSGIGSALIRAGLELLRARGERIVLVLGHPDYYPRFGFSAALAATLDSPFPRPAFMALELVPGAFEGVRGRVRYARAFGL